MAKSTNTGLPAKAATSEKESKQVSGLEQMMYNYTVDITDAVNMARNMVRLPPVTAQPSGFNMSGSLNSNNPSNRQGNQ